ncbi:MAG TPA: TetR/AcrR family transcriptional regulator [Ktedonobacteraceae bacterium]|nr:TetR/AcrR family transcriptional regulator [Ktedonobacteraceae bacterium]
MSPRPYRLGQRQTASEQTRTRIVAAARELLMSPGGYSTFSIETVARQADVARMTVYHRFGSKLGLLEALCDSLAASSGIEELGTAFQQPEPREALNRYIEIFGRFWDADRLIMRRLRALAALDPDVAQLMQTRDEWRRRGGRAIAQRLLAKEAPSAGEIRQENAHGFSSDESQASSPGEDCKESFPGHWFAGGQALPADTTFNELVDVLFLLTSFETFDVLAGSTRSPLEVVPIVQRLARAALEGKTRGASY